MGMIDLDALLDANNGILFARDHRRLKSSLSRWVKKGRLGRPIRGAYTRPNFGFAERVTAVIQLIPRCVIAGQAAIALRVPNVPVPPVIEVHTPSHHVPQQGFHFVQRLVPDHYVHHHVMSPVLAAVDQANTSTDGIDLMMRQGMAKPEAFQTALQQFPHRRGNTRRRIVVKRTGTKPLSLAERNFHDLLDKHHIKGWVANERIKVDGEWRMPDVRFRAVKLIAEIDGWRYHSSHEAFENDRKRQNLLVKNGYTVLRFTWDDLDCEPNLVIATIKAALTLLHRKHPSG